MVSKISEGVKITVESFYRPESSSPINNHFMFSYKIIIENHNPFAIRLLSRYWHIFDSFSEIREVNGEGVVGLKPMIEPGSQFEYISNCNLKSDMGQMMGYYVMQNMSTMGTFKVNIPAMLLVSTPKLN